MLSKILYALLAAMVFSGLCFWFKEYVGPKDAILQSTMKCLERSGVAFDGSPASRRAWATCEGFAEVVHGTATTRAMGL